MRLVCCLLLLCLTVPIGAADVQFVRVWPGYRTAESFVGIREYFGGAESTGRRTIIRSQPQARGGYYWLARVQSDEAQPQVTAELTLIRPGRAEPETHRFELALARGKRAVLLGLTGTDWPDESASPTAWRLRLIDSEGRVLASEQSFLWELPDSGETQDRPRS